MKKIIAIFFFLGISSMLCQAQSITYLESNQNTQVNQGAGFLLNPWCGGMNAPQVQKADLNNDGIDDLVLFDHTTRTLQTFIKQSNSVGFDYKYDPSYAKLFPTTLFYLILEDYNCDNVPDLFHRGYVGYSVHKGKYVNGKLTFTFYKDLYFPGTFGQVNAYVQPNDVPSIVDIDCDGDLDFLSFDVLGAYLGYYKNTRVENNYSCDSITIVQEATCWGNMYQTFNREHVLGASCKSGNPGLNKNRHTGNAVLHLDIDGDGDYDMLGGNVGFNDVQLLINGGICGADNITSQDTFFDANNHQLELYSWPVPKYEDMDNDDVNDLVFTPHTNNASSANYNLMAFYKNTGSNASPIFQWKNDSILIDNMLDFGSFSYPTLFDYDKDGKKDLFVGNAGYFNSITKTAESKVAYYRNTSTPNNISFQLITRDFLNLSSKNYTGIYPCFGDITGDGLTDLILGNENGSLAVYKNIASSELVIPNLILETDSMPGIDAGDYSFPLVYDYNQDGKTDLLIGNDIGNIILYIDSSLTSSKNLKLKSTTLGNIKSGGSFTFLGYAAPFIGKLDVSSSNDVLLLGTADGTIEVYDSVLNNFNTIVRKDSFYSDIQTAYRSKPVLDDLDGNNVMDMIVGSQNGGLQLFHSTGPITVSNFSERSFEMDVFPNPTNDLLYIRSHELKNSSEQKIELVDILGRHIMVKSFTVADHQIELDITSLTEGMYILRLEVDGKIAQKKIVKQ